MQLSLRENKKKYFCGIRTSHFIHSISRWNNGKENHGFNGKFTETMMRMKFCFDILWPTIMTKSMITYQWLKIRLIFQTYRTGCWNSRIMNKGIGKYCWFKTSLNFFQCNHNIFKLFGIIIWNTSRIIIVIIILKWICIIVVGIITIVI